MIPVKPVVESVSPIPAVEQTPAATPAPVEVTQTSVIPSKVEPLSKNAYDSLAPLNVPSKPVVYVNNPEQEAAAAESVSQTDTKPSQGQETSGLNGKTDAATSDTSGDTSRMDEKAKLESILMSSMSQTSSAYKQGGDGASMSLNNGGPHKHKFSAGNVGSMGNNNNGGTNGATNIGNWPPRMPMTPSRLPPNYLCTICKKPGHLKSLCPEAVIILK